MKMSSEEENKVISEKMVTDDGHTLVCVIGGLVPDSKRTVKQSHQRRKSSIINLELPKDINNSSVQGHNNSSVTQSGRGVWD